MSILNFEKCIKGSFVVIGKEGSTKDGADFVQALWQDANSHFDEVAPLAKKDENGNLLGVWGVMSDFSHSFLPWDDDFSKGLYLAGVECFEDTEAPDGWTKWVVPAYEYLCTEKLGNMTFSQMISYLNQNQISLVGAVQEFICPETGKNYLFCPIRKI